MAEIKNISDYCTDAVKIDSSTPSCVFDGTLFLLYTQIMDNDSPRWWDWLAAGFLFIAMLVAAGRLLATNWIPHLDYVGYWLRWE